MTNYDYLIVGAGFSGSVLAERLSSVGKKVILIDKREHVGGVCYDYYNKAGVLVHKYGPHYFRTNFLDVKKYLSSFTQWIFCNYYVKAYTNGYLYTLPINRNTLNEVFNINLKTEKEAKEFLNSQKININKPKNAEEQILASAGRKIYKTFFKNYIKKQWNIDPKKLCPSITARIPIRTNTDNRYVDDKFQAMPRDGYTKLFKNMLKGIKVVLNTDFKEIKDEIRYDNLIYTGSIDDFFKYKYGKLLYRSLKFKFKTYDKEFHQDWLQINYPNDFKFTRKFEIKHATKQKIPRTTVVKEYPSSKGESYYPILDSKNLSLYKKYQKEARKLKGVYFTGRLAQYKYLNMDQVIKNSLNLFERLCKQT